MAAFLICVQSVLICGEKSLMKPTRIAAPDFDLAMTLNSGQVFHWEKVGRGFSGAIDDAAVYVEQDGEELRVMMEGGAPATPGSQELAPPLAALVANYFALDHPLAEICSSFPDVWVMNA